MEPLVKELIVLQIIYSFMLSKIKQDEHFSKAEDESQDTTSYDDVIISSSMKISLIKIINEVQNNVLLKEIMRVGESTAGGSSTRMNINEILTIIRELFPLQRIVLADGQLSFRNLKIVDLKGLIREKYGVYRDKQVKFIKQLDDTILKLKNLQTEDSWAETERKSIANVERVSEETKQPAVTATTRLPTSSSSSPSSSSSSSSSSPSPPSSSLPLSQSTVTVEVPPSVAPGTATAARSTATTPPTTTTTTASATKPKNRVTKPQTPPVKATDSKREKLLQLYRDTVLNKLQSKNKILDRLFANLGKRNTSRHIVNELLQLEKIKTTTPLSVHNLHFILQKSVTDGVMSSVTGSRTWAVARQAQVELDDTVQFMRRALE